jgi:two-component system copper resistance phosphate regulon response regulator CusR
MRILVIEDDAEIADMICFGLGAAGHLTDHAADGRAGLGLANENVYALIILDLMLPKMNGWQVCERLRASRCPTAILMLTARDSVDDRVRGLDLGADDYLAKPFAFQELSARVRALLRRDRLHRTRVIHIADLEVDTAQRRVKRAGAEIALSRREYDLLEALASQEGRILSREAIQERIWMNETAVQSTVDVYIGLLRKKVDSGHPIKLIHTVYGVGYTVRVPEYPS